MQTVTSSCVCLQFLNPEPSTLLLHRIIFSVITQILASVCWVILEAALRLFPQLQNIRKSQEITPNPDTFLAVLYRDKSSFTKIQLKTVFLCKKQPVMLKKAQQQRNNPSHCEKRECIFLTCKVNKCFTLWNLQFRHLFLLQKYNFSPDLCIYLSSVFPLYQALVKVNHFYHIPIHLSANLSGP